MNPKDSARTDMTLTYLRLYFWSGVLCLALGVLNLGVTFSLIPVSKSAGQTGSWIWLFTGLMGVAGGIGLLIKAGKTNSKL